MGKNRMSETINKINKVRLPKEDICLSDFVSRFSAAYFIKKDDKNKIEGICYRQTSCWVENEILKESVWDRRGLAKILAWKIGRIKQKDSDNNESNNNIVYSCDWKDCEKQNPMLYGNPLNIDKLCNFLNGNKDEILNSIECGNLEDCFNLVKKNEVKYIGEVYLMTLIFFISDGKYPIYDRFANVAVNDIFRECIPKKGDADSNCSFKMDRYKKYKEKMDSLYKQLYGNEKINYKRRRDLDRALWVYGHGYKKQG